MAGQRAVAAFHSNSLYLVALVSLYDLSQSFYTSVCDSFM